MASIGGLTSSTSNSLTGTNSLKGYGGLASGLDRDSLIESMTSGTQSKIQKQKQNQQKLQWQQEAIRTITDKMYAFSQKYTSYTSGTNLSSSSFFSRNQITSIGTNSKYVSVTGNSPLIDQISIAGVKQLAKNAQVSSSSNVSWKSITTGTISLDSSGLLDKTNVSVSNLAGQSFSIKYGNDSYSIKLPGTAEYDYGVSAAGNVDLEKTVEQLNKVLSETKLNSGEGNLGETFEFQYDKNTGKIDIHNKGKAGNSIELVRGDEFFQSIGILGKEQKLSDLTEDEKTIASSGEKSTLKGKNAPEVKKQRNMAEMLKETKLSFEYNGETKWIEFGEDIEFNTMEEYQKALQKELDKQFGKGRIEIGLNSRGTDYSLSFKTTTPDGSDDKTSTLAITSSTTYGILGENGILKLKENSSNRLELDQGLDQLGDTVLADIFGEVPTKDKVLESTIVINGVDIKISSNDSMKEILDKINHSDAGVNVEYLSNLDKFSITATEMGASGEIAFGATADQIKELTDKYEDQIKEIDDKISKLDSTTSQEEIDKLTEQKKSLEKQKADVKDNTTSQAFLDIMKVNGKDNKPAIANGVAFSEGQDAIIAIKYKGSDEVTEIVRGSNSFKLDGLNVSVNGTFGYKEVEDPIAPNGTRLELDKTAEAVTFEAKANTEEVTTAVKEMIEAFNEIIDAVSEQVSSKQSKSDKYEPLTDQQKAEMSEDQIKQWEEKAKVGILYNDTELRGLMDALRFVLPSGADRQALSEIGITVSSNYSDNGKLTFDEEKFKAAMESDPDKVKELFTKSKVTDANGNVTQQAGLITNIKTVMDRYASTTGATKGILIERAGSQKAPTTVLKNAMQTQFDQIAKTIERLQETLKSEQNRYINQFTQLETVISNMNAQSAWLSQLQ